MVPEITVVSTTGARPTWLVRAGVERNSRSIYLRQPQPATGRVLFWSVLLSVSVPLAYVRTATVTCVTFLDMLFQFQYEHENTASAQWGKAKAKFACWKTSDLQPLNLRDNIMFTSQTERLTTRPLRFRSKSSLKSRVIAKVNGGV